MMQTGFGFTWPMLLMPVLILIGMTIVLSLATRTHRDHIGLGIGRGCHTHRHNDQRSAQSIVREDPIVILRERFARGDIAIEEFKLRVDELLRSEQVK